MTILSYKTRLIISPPNEAKLWAMLEAERTAWNECSKYCFNLDKRNINTLHKVFYKQYRSKNQVPSQLIIEVERSVLAAYQSAKSNNNSIDKPFVKKKLSMQFDNRTFTRKNDIIKLTSITKHDQIICDFEVYDHFREKLQYGILPPKVIVRNGELLMVISIDVPCPKQVRSKVLGIDLGVENLVATSDGKLYKDKTYLKNKRKVRYLKRCLKSKGTKSAKRHLKKVRNKEENQTKDFVHRLTKHVLQTNCDIIAVEKLQVKKLKSKQGKQIRKTKDSSKTLSKKQGRNNHISQAPFALFVFVLTYKALLLGKQVITVSPYYTSKIDSRTGKRDGLRNGGRFYAKDGKVLHADINAACNIAKRHIEHLPEHPCSMIVPYNCHARQVAINQPNVSLAAYNPLGLSQR